MKLRTLDLLAYGPFTDRTLDFNSAKSSFHVIFGSNEAGKSSSLRALLALLYGIPARTQDNFRHENKELRVGGLLQHSDGKELEFRRRKGNKNTLMNTAGAAIDDASLRDFLAGIDRARFEAVFGIDHERLAKGAQAILSGEGDVGESLFSAGVGTANLREVLDQLDAEAEELYKSRGSKPKINAALAAYKASTKKVREHTLLSSGWTKQRKQLQRLRRQQQELATEQSALRTESTRLRCLSTVLPKLALRTELLVELKALQDVIDLADDFAERRRAAEQTRVDATKTGDKAAGELDATVKEVGDLQVPEGLIADQVAVNDLYRELGSIQTGEDHSKKLQGRVDVLRAAAHVLLDGLPTDVKLDDIDEIRPKADTTARVRRLTEPFQVTSAAPKRARLDVTGCERSLKTAQDALEALPQPRAMAPLRQLVARTRKLGELETAHRAKVQALATAQDQAALALRGLRLWSGSLADCEGLAVPGNPTVNHHQEAMRDAQTAVTTVAAAIKKCEAGLAEQREMVKAIEVSGAVLTEADLRDVRDRRAGGWRRVRQAWLGEAAPEGAEKISDDLPAVYEGLVEEADGVADRLRREAERVASFAELEARRERLQRELADLQEQRKAASIALEAATAAWTEVWMPIGVQPQSPLEMRSWLDSHAKVVKLAAAAREAAGSVNSQQQLITALRGELSEALTALGEPKLGEAETLAAGLDRADSIVELLTKTERLREELQTALPNCTKELEDARGVEGQAVRALEDWRRDWTAAVSELGLEGSAAPTEANAVLDRFTELFKNFDEARATTGRLKGIHRDAKEFADKVAVVVQRVAPDLVGRPTNQAVESLHERLARAQTDAATRLQLDKRIKDLNATIAASKAEHERALSVLADLCTEASCELPADLKAAERRSSDKADRKQGLVQLQEQITDLGGGSTVDALVRQADAIDPDALPGQLEELKRQATALDTQRSELDQQIGSAEAEFKRLDGGDAAADEAAAAQAALARLGTYVERYVRVKLAAKLLRAEIERYREEHQGPLLKRAGEIFSTLTLGSFAELGADYNDKDQPVLVGVRSNGERVDVQGLSDGTTDQLYLAIRLATLEQHLATHEPIPFVVDDILVHFDDDRAYAALQVLAELSKKTQVLFFTHHARLVELATKLGDGVAEVHEL